MLTDNVDKMCYAGGRMSGRTQVLIDGWKPGVVIVTATVRHARDIRGRLPKDAPRNSVVAIGDLQPYGMRCPVVFDHFAYEVELRRLERKIDKLQEKINDKS